MVSLREIFLSAKGWDNCPSAQIGVFQAACALRIRFSTAALRLPSRVAIASSFLLSGGASKTVVLTCARGFRPDPARLPPRIFRSVLFAACCNSFSKWINLKIFRRPENSTSARGSRSGEPSRFPSICMNPMNLRPNPSAVFKGCRWFGRMPNHARWKRALPRSFFCGVFRRMLSVEKQTPRRNPQEPAGRASSRQHENDRRLYPQTLFN